MTASLRALSRSLGLTIDPVGSGRDAVAVRYRDSEWHVDGVGQGVEDLTFTNPADAERVAIAIARRRGCAALVFGRHGRLVDAYLPSIDG